MTARPLVPRGRGGSKCDFDGIARSAHRDEAAAAPESLLIVLVDVTLVMPMIAGTTLFAYRIFGGKATNLTDD